MIGALKDRDFSGEIRNWGLSKVDIVTEARGEDGLKWVHRLSQVPCRAA